MSIVTPEKRDAWERQSRKQYAWVAAFSLGIQLYAAATGIVMTRARSASWWVTLVSVLAGLWIWLPVWRLMRESGEKEWTGEILKTMGCVAGKAVLLLMGGIFLFDAAIAMKLLSMLVRQYVISGSMEVVVSLCSIAMLGLGMGMYGAQSLSRLTWLIRFFLLLILLIGVAAIYPSAQVENLSPLLGENAEKTLKTIPGAAGAYAGIAALPLFRKAGEEEKRMGFWEGAKPMLLAAVMAGCLMLLDQLTISPLMISDSIFWARRLLMGAEVVENGYILQVLFLLGLMGALMISMGFGMVSCAKCLGEVLETQKQGGVMALCMCAMAIFAVGTGSEFTNALWKAMEGRLPLTAAALWLTWGVSRARRMLQKRGGKEKP